MVLITLFDHCWLNGNDWSTIIKDKLSVVIWQKTMRYDELTRKAHLEWIWTTALLLISLDLRNWVISDMRLVLRNVDCTWWVYENVNYNRLCEILLKCNSSWSCFGWLWSNRTTVEQKWLTSEIKRKTRWKSRYQLIPFWMRLSQRSLELALAGTLRTNRHLRRNIEQRLSPQFQ